VLDAWPAVGASDDKIDLIFAIMSLRWLNSMTVTAAITNSIRNRYSILRQRLLAFELITCLETMGFGDDG
jgi:hypothetical protein